MSQTGGIIRATLIKPCPVIALSKYRSVAAGKQEPMNSGRAHQWQVKDSSWQIHGGVTVVVRASKCPEWRTEYSHKIRLTFTQGRNEGTFWHLHLCLCCISSLCLCQVSDTGGQQYRRLRCPITWSSWLVRPVRGHPSRNLPPSTPTPWPCATLAPSLSPDPSCACKASAAPLHDNGALLIIPDRSSPRWWRLECTGLSHGTNSLGIQACSLRGMVIIDHIVEACMDHKGSCRWVVLHLAHTVSILKRATALSTHFRLQSSSTTELSLKVKKFHVVLR